MRKLLMLLGMVMLLLSNSIAQSVQVDTIKIIDLDPVVITAQFAPQSEKNAIYKVHVFDSITMSQKGVNNLQELLQQELNLDLSQKAVLGASIAIQGISKENIKVLIDGVPVIGRLNGIIDLNQINLSNIEKVEMIEGPVSVFYGTDAMGGIINLITKKTQQKALEGNISAFYESINATSVKGNIGYKFGKNIIRLNAGVYSFDGLSTNESPRNLNWEKRNQYFTDLMYVRDLGSLKLRYNGSLAKDQLFSIGEPDKRNKIKDQDYYTQRINNSLNLQGNILDDKFLEITLSYLDYQRYHNTFDIDPGTFESTPSTKDLKEDNMVKFKYGGAKLQIGKSNKVDKINYAFGADMNVETTEGGRILDGKQDIQTLALFSSLNYKLSENFEIQPGARYTWNSSYGAVLSPAFNSKIRFNNFSTLRFSYARGYRAPSLKELFLDFHVSTGPNTFIISGNEGLKVEKSHSFNLQYTLNAQLGSVGSLLIAPSIFYNEIDNLIALSEIVDFKRNYINIDKFKSIGGKIDFTYLPNEAFTIKAGYGLVGRYNHFTENFETKDYVYSPEAVASLSYYADNANLNFNIFYKYSGKQEGFFVDKKTKKLQGTTRGSYHNLNATMSKSFFNNVLNASIGVKNLFDVKDIVTSNEVREAHSRDLQLWGRSFFIKTTLNF